MIIAIDGPAASGKGTIAKGLAKHFDLPHLDTGLLYRAIGYALIDSLTAPDLVERAEKLAINLDVENLDPAILGATDVSMAAAKVARIPRVRAALFDLQTSFATQEGGAVLDGRDIGSRICPQAEAKLFITALPEVRASRRAKQLSNQENSVDEADILDQIRRRDESDKENPAGAFYPGEGALLLDTSELDIEAALEAAIALVNKATGQGMGG
ncbi:MAG: (d)CMP kinase [Devosiaceae bacterium]|nr:(d)CMP kinase [Devosiaceae bacterium]